MSLRNAFVVLILLVACVSGGAMAQVIGPALTMQIVSPEDGAVYAFGKPIPIFIAFVIADYPEYPPPEPTMTLLIDGGPIPPGGLGQLVPGPHTFSATMQVGDWIATDSVTFTIANSLGKVTGGGWLLGPTRCTFALVAANQGSRPSLRGNLVFHDHDTLLSVNSMSITGLGIAGSSAVIAGTCAVNGEPGHTFTLSVTDAGKGKANNGDTFSIALDTGYHTSGILGGGSISICESE